MSETSPAVLVLCRRRARCSTSSDPGLPDRGQGGVAQVAQGGAQILVVELRQGASPPPSPISIALLESLGQGRLAPGAATTRRFLRRRRHTGDLRNGQASQVVQNDRLLLSRGQGCQRSLQAMRSGGAATAGLCPGGSTRWPTGAAPAAGREIQATLRTHAAGSSYGQILPSGYAPAERLLYQVLGLGDPR